MKSKSGKATAVKAYKQKLDSPVTFTFDYETYENISEVKAAKDEPSDSEVVKFRNAQRKANARAKALTAQLDAMGIKKPTIENDEQLRLEEMFKVLMSSKKYTEEAARELASSTLGIEWDDDSDE